MTKLLLKLAAKNGEPSYHAAVGKLSGTVGIICNVLLFVLKITVGLIIGSVSIIADALNNISDAASSVVTLLGFKMAQEPADRDHPYGHARYEYISGLVISGLILVIGFDLLKSSFGKMIEPVSVKLSAAVFIILVISVLIKLWMMLFYGKCASEISSASLKAAAVDSRNDVIVTSVIILGCAIEFFTKLRVDGFAGLGCALFILYSGIKLAGETVSPLLGERVDRELINKIEDIVLSHEKIIGIHDLLVHDYGPGRYYASLHAEISADEDPLVCHDIIDHIECDILSELNVHLVIHYDPVVSGDEEWDEMHRLTEEIICTISPSLSVHDFRMVRGAAKTKLTFDIALPYSMTTPEKKRELKRDIDRMLSEKGKDYDTVIRFDAKE